VSILRPPLQPMSLGSERQVVIRKATPFLKARRTGILMTQILQAGEATTQHFPMDLMEPSASHPLQRTVDDGLGLNIAVPDSTKTCRPTD
jgi:hypothetical protein